MHRKNEVKSCTARARERGIELSAPFGVPVAGVGRILTCIVLITALLFTAKAQDSTVSHGPYFYKGLDYGSQSTFNPITVIINGGFDMLQVGNNRDVTKIPWSKSFSNVMANFANPIKPINNYGWWNFMQDQVIPISLRQKDGQWWPNYTLHLVGGGMEYAMTKEWYEYHNFEYPTFYAVMTMASYHMINEITENLDLQGDNVDPIADLWLFDAGGIVLFSFDNVKRFFSEDLNLTDWSTQPSFSLKDGRLHNVGQYFSIKWKLPFSDKWHLFYYFGLNGLGGLSYKRDDGSSISVGVGFKTKDLIDLDKAKNKKTVELVPNMGFFYDVNNSLMASVSLSAKTDYVIQANLYPGLVKIGRFSPGFWCAITKSGGPILGLTAAMAPVNIAYP
jgi:hypothetical protein